MFKYMYKLTRLDNLNTFLLILKQITQAETQESFVKWEDGGGERRRMKERMGEERGGG